MAIQNEQHRNSGQSRGNEEEQATKGGHEPVKNPFREPDAPLQAPTADEEAAAEQQRKEALTERD